MKHPPVSELLASVSRFLRDELLPTLSGASAFNLRVSINAVDLVRREIEQQGGADQRERLAKLLGSDADLETMRKELCERIARGELTLAEPALGEHLRATTIDRLAIDQPTYSAYLAALGRSDGAKASDDKKSEE
jgi:uncharacterized protein DUF6285